MFQDGIMNKQIRSYRFKDRSLMKQAEELFQKISKIDNSLFFKSSSIGGEPESGFEQSFAQLAYTYIQDKAPRLLDYLVGFQIVDRNDDANKSLGVFGFKVGNRWMYAPVFFLNGDVKGHELLYLKDKDQFVPLKENWINYVIAQQPHILGEGSMKSPEELGVRSPDLRTILAIPRVVGKYASDSTWLDGFMPMLAAATVSPGKLFSKCANAHESLDVLKLMASDVAIMKTAMDWMDEYPVIKKAFYEFYSEAQLRDALLGLKKSAESGTSVLGGVKVKTVVAKPKGVLKKVAAADKPKLDIQLKSDEIITENKAENNEAEKEKLLRDGYLIKDHRSGDEVSIAYNTQQPFELTNPSESGIYDVVVKPGEFSRCLVISNPHSADGRVGMVTVVRLDGKKTWLNADRSRIWVRDGELREDYEKWRNDLSAGSLSRGGVYLIVSEKGEGSVPFRVVSDLGDGLYRIAEAEGKAYDFHRSEILPEVDAHSSNYHSSCNGEYYVRLNARKGTTLRSYGGTLNVPEGAKILKIRDPEPGLKDDDYVSSYLDNRGDSGDDAIQPGDLADIQMQIMNKTAELKIWNDNHEVIINRQRMSKLAGLIHLVRDHGFREGDAKQMLKEAERKLGARYRVKYAESPFLTDNFIQVPYAEDQAYASEPWSGVPTQAPSSTFLGIPSMSSGNTDQSVYDPNVPPQPQPQLMQAAQQATQLGQKEVFDTSMMSSLLRSTSKSSIVDRYLPDLRRALDRLGKLLFMFFWRNDFFIDTYGKSDAPELEDSLRNSFDVLGDLWLFLAAKTIAPFDGHGGGEPDIEDSTGE